MMRWSLFFCLLLLSTFCSAQLVPLEKQKYADSLSAILKSNATDSLKAEISFDLSKYWMLERDTAKAKFYLQEGKKRSGKSPYLQARYIYGTGWLYMHKDNKTAKKYFLKADSLLALVKNKGGYLVRAGLWRNYAQMVQYEDDNEQTLDIMINKVVPYTQLSGHKTSLGLAYVNIAIVLDNLDQYDKAAIYWKKSIEIYESLPLRSWHRVAAYIHSAKNSMIRKKYAEARLLLDKAKQLLEKDKTISFYVDYCEAESQYLMDQKQYEKSLLILAEGMKAAESLKLDAQKNALLQQKYKVLSLQGKYEAAKEVILKIVENHDRYEATFIDDKISDYQEVYKTYDKLKNIPEAYKWLQKYTFLRDSANQTQLKEEINKLEVKFRSAENQKKIVELNSANEKNKLKAKNNRLIGFITSLFLLVVAVFGWLLYRKSKKLSAQEELSHKQEIKEIAQREQIKMAQAMLQGQEEERKRVAQDLHDGLGGMLAGVKMNLSVFATKERKEEKEKSDLYGIIEQLDQSANELRRIAYNMMPETLLRFGLETSLRELCESFISNHLAVDFQYFGSKNALPIQEQISIYRIVQELLTNAYKHADAKKILVQCSQDEGAFLITVEDDGIGFDPSRVKPGMGLANIRNRVDYMKGAIDIAAGPNQQGTVIDIELKLQ